MERPLVTAVTHSTAEARITLTGLPDRPGIAGRVLTALADANVNVDMIIQNEPADRGPPGRHVVHRPARRPARPRARRSSRSRRSSASARSRPTTGMGKVSLVGAGMKSHPGVAAKTFTVLGEAGVNIEMISTSPIKISCVVREEDVETAVRELHTAFGLGADAVLPEDVAGVHRPKVALACMRVAVVGATGAVGSTMLDVHARARASPPTRSCRSPRSARPGARSTTATRDLTVVALSDDDDPGLRPRAVLGRLGRQRRVGAALRRRRRRGGRQLVAVAHARRRAARGLRGQPARRSRATAGSSPTPTARRCRRWWRSARS